MHPLPLKQLTIGNRTFSSNLIQGPLAGVSCYPFRRLVWKYSQPAYTCSEMISCKTLNHQAAAVHKRFVSKDITEGPVCFQLSGSEPKEIADAVKRITDYGADLIDINCGCPVKKIRSRGAGSSLLTNPTGLFKAAQTLKQNTHVPVGIKIRVEGYSEEKFHQEVIQVCKDSGIDFLIVHGRHWTEKYDIACHYDQIKIFVENLSIPVIGNGDINNIASLKKMLATGCSGAMISRAGVGQPWLIQQLISEMNNSEYIKPRSAEIGNVFIEHILELSKLLENEKFAVLHARKLAKYYARSLDDKTEFCDLVNNCDDLSKLIKITANFFSESQEN